MWFRRKKVPASELFGQLSATRNNIPPENMGDGVTRRVRSMSDPMYSAKYYRKKFGEQNKYDLAEEKLERICNFVIYEVYNRSFKLLPILHKDNTLKNGLEELYIYLSSLLNENSYFEILDSENIPYLRFLDYSYGDELVERINDANAFFKNVNEQENLNKALEMDDYILKKVKSALIRIESLNNPIHEEILERMDFYGYKNT